MVVVVGLIALAGFVLVVAGLAGAAVVVLAAGAGAAVGLVVVGAVVTGFVVVVVEVGAAVGFVVVGAVVGLVYVDVCAQMRARRTKQMNKTFIS